MPAPDAQDALPHAAASLSYRRVQGTRAHAVRSARTCFDHIAGRLGVALFASLLEGGLVAGGDGRHLLNGRGADRLSARGRDVDYRLTVRGRARLAELGVALPEPTGDRELPLRYCVDWSEQAHHLSGTVGRAVAERLLALGWLRRAERSRALHVTAAGRDGLARELGVTRWG